MVHRCSSGAGSARRVRSATGCWLNYPVRVIVLPVTAFDLDSTDRSGEVRVAIKKALLIGVGALITVAGVVFTLQGLNFLGGSVMSGVTFWAVAGPLIAVAGIILAGLGIRYRGSTS
jgi:hypothetical protein